MTVTQLWALLYQKSLQTERVYGQHFVLLLLRDFGTEAQEQPTSLVGSRVPPLHHLFPLGSTPSPLWPPHWLFCFWLLSEPITKPPLRVSVEGHLQPYANSIR